MLRELVAESECLATGCGCLMHTDMDQVNRELVCLQTSIHANVLYIYWCTKCTCTCAWQNFIYIFCMHEQINQHINIGVDMLMYRYITHMISMCMPNYIYSKSICIHIYTHATHTYMHEQSWTYLYAFIGTTQYVYIYILCIYIYTLNISQCVIVWLSACACIDICYTCTVLNPMCTVFISCLLYIVLSVSLVSKCRALIGPSAWGSLRSVGAQSRCKDWQQLGRFSAP